MRSTTRTTSLPPSTYAAGEGAVAAPRYAGLSTSTPLLSCATSFTSAVNLFFFSSFVRYGVKCRMHSRVDALGVARSHSMTMRSSSSAPGGSCALRFFRRGTLPGTPPAAPAEPSSVALRLRAFAPPDADGAGGGLPAVGLVARLAGGDAPLGLASGLPARLGMAVFSLGIFGLVARLATTEWPPCPGAGAGDVGREIDCGSGSVLGVDGGCPFAVGLPACRTGDVWDADRAPGLGSTG